MLVLFRGSSVYARYKKGQRWAAGKSVPHASFSFGSSIDKVTPLHRRACRVHGFNVRRNGTIVLDIDGLRGSERGKIGIGSTRIDRTPSATHQAR